MENDALEGYENKIVGDVMGFLNIEQPTEFQNPDASLDKIERIWRDEPQYYTGGHFIGETQPEEPRKIPPKFIFLHEAAGRQVYAENEFEIRMRGRFNRAMVGIVLLFAGAVFLILMIRGG